MTYLDEVCCYSYCFSLRKMLKKITLKKILYFINHDLLKLFMISDMFYECMLFLSSCQK